MPAGNSPEWTYAEQLANSLHNPKIFLPEDVCLKFGAHVQIHLLPRAQVQSYFIFEGNPKSDRYFS